MKLKTKREHLLWKEAFIAAFGVGLAFADSEEDFADRFLPEAGDMADKAVKLYRERLPTFKEQQLGQ